MVEPGAVAVRWAGTAKAIAKDIVIDSVGENAWCNDDPDRDGLR
jgi:hypothetical protein